MNNETPSDASPCAAEPNTAASSPGAIEAAATSQGDGIAGAPSITRARAGGGPPLFEVLGHHNRLFYFRTEALGVQSFNMHQLHRVGAATLLVPDMAHWRAAYGVPGKPQSVDWERVGADLVRLALEAGPYAGAPSAGRVRPTATSKPSAPGVAA